MKKLISKSILILVLTLVASSYTASAATSVKVKASVHSYKGQQYVQINGSNKSVMNKINKVLKGHAVNAAKLDRESKADNKSYYYKSIVETKYNNDGKLSVVYTDTLYSGGVHANYGTITYNFDLKTGDRIKLKSIVNNEKKTLNLVEAISSNLKSKYYSGESIFEESINDFPLDSNSNFYFYNKGIVIRFDPYEVGPFSEGVIDVFVNYATLDKANKYAYPPTTSSSLAVEAQIDDIFRGFDEGNLYELTNGQTWKQVDNRFESSFLYRAEVLIYKDGNKNYMRVQGMKGYVEVEKVK